MPFEQLLQTVAVVEYDFDNGQDKDAMAKKVLGEQGYLKNKQRLSQANAPRTQPPAKAPPPRRTAGIPPVTRT